MTLAVARNRGAVEAASTAKGWESLAAALSHEARLLDELRSILIRQRGGVAKNDSVIIEDCVDAMGRALHTLQEARKRRVALIELITGGSGHTLTDVPRLLGEPVPELLSSAKDGVQAAASSVAREAAINQHVIKRSLEAGEAFIQKLFTDGGVVTPVYDPSDGNAEGSRSDAVLVNRRA